MAGFFFLEIQKDILRLNSKAFRGEKQIVTKGNDEAQVFFNPLTSDAPSCAQK